MKNRALVSLFIVSVFIVACVAPPSEPAAEIIPTQPPATFTPVLLAAAPTTTTIPLPAPAGVQPTAAFTIPAPLPLVGVGSPLASPNSGTLNCRTGPDIIWAVTALVNHGQNVEIVGKSADALWWYVKHPTAPTGSCWVSAAFVNVSGNVSSVQIVAVDLSVAVYGTPVPVITSIFMSLEPNTIDAPGCVGSGQSIKIVAKIQTNGPMILKLHFEDLQSGVHLSTRKMTFDRADIKDITDSFTPPINAGTFKVVMHVDDIDLGGLGGVASYTITC